MFLNGKLCRLSRKSPLNMQHLTRHIAENSQKQNLRTLSIFLRIGQLQENGKLSFDLGNSRVIRETWYRCLLSKNGITFW